MGWSSQQDRALKSVSEWLSDPGSPQVFRLFGYAGTGKTTLAKHFAEGVSGDVLFAAYTGKAAHVLKKKGCPNAATIHSLIYHVADKSSATLDELNKQLEALVVKLKQSGIDPLNNKDACALAERIRQEKNRIRQPSFRLNLDSPVRQAKLIIVDECSMVDDRMGTDLLSFGTKVLVLGDPAQLPPVRGCGFFTEGVSPDIMLDEIHRQAKDSPVVRLATLVRNGNDLPLGKYGESSVIEMRDLTKDHALSSNQIIVGLNKTRRNYNARMRQIYNFSSSTPEKDDKLVCLRNNHDIGLLNGSIWYSISCLPASDDRLWMTVESEDGGTTLDIECHAQPFLGGADDMPYYERKEANEFDFGYAMTCHKAQGSQWDSVLVIDESRFFRSDRNRWLYTAITRAAECVVVAR